VGHFNVSDSVALRAVTEAARELNAPVLIGVSEGEREFIGVRQIAALVKAIRDEYGQPIFLNADHSHSVRSGEEAARAGFDMVHFDGSRLPVEENLRETRRVVEAVKAINPAIAVEGEIADSETAGPHAAADRATEFVAATSVDVLAPAAGNIHGMLRSMVEGRERKHLHIEKIRATKDAVHIPLTLHGGSGTDDADLRKAIQAGITIVHISTELRLAWRKGVQAALARQWDEMVPYKLLTGPLTMIKEAARARLELFQKPEGLGSSAGAE